MSSPLFKILPSDLSYLWDQCPRCFHAKIIGGRQVPRTPFPAVFGTVDKAMKAMYSGCSTDVVAGGNLPAGAFESASEWVQSRPFPKKGPRQFYFLGKRDINIEFEDTSLGIVDFKFAKINAEKVGKYARQVGAYGWSMEHPAKGEARVVSKLGLLSFEAQSMHVGDPKKPTADGTFAAANLLGSLRWYDVPMTTKDFETFMIEMVALLSQETPPAPTAGCEWCKLYD